MKSTGKHPKPPYQVIWDVGHGEESAEYDHLDEARAWAGMQSGRLYAWLDEQGRRALCHAQIWDRMTDPARLLETWIDGAVSDPVPDLDTDRG